MGQEEIVVANGVLNWSVAFNGASVRENPESEKSFQLSVLRLAARDYRLTKFINTTNCVTYW